MNMTIDYMNIDEKYILVQKIGQGKNGRVFLGVDETGKACAFKFYLDKVDAEIDFRPAVHQNIRDRHFEATIGLLEDVARRLQ
jgi:RIO-like serine/threonine protein kinase